MQTSTIMSIWFFFHKKTPYLIFNEGHDFVLYNNFYI